jgi:hypothetical protein
MARQRLRDACMRLPISMILLGWDLPPKFEEAIATETVRQGARLYRWQPWLTADSRTNLPPEWTVVGSDDIPIPGYNADPAFTFVCPNQSGVADFLMERLDSIAARGIFQGIFLDRIRFPSPSDDPVAHLGCFCKHCARLAADTTLNLDLVRQCLQSAKSNKGNARQLVCSLLGSTNSLGKLLEDFLYFRTRSITRTVTLAKRHAESLGLFLGLDCFSPALTHMVGQDLQMLDGVCDWMKLMLYPRVFSPAGLPFELLGLSSWLIHAGWTELEAISILSEATGLALPGNLTALRKVGLGTGTIAHEIEFGRYLGVTHLLAGIALAKMKTINRYTSAQVQADILATRIADGLVISWDLWHTPLEYLDTISSLWEL